LQADHIIAPKLHVVLRISWLLTFFHLK